jgi:hypothetical protein
MFKDLGFRVYPGPGLPKNWKLVNLYYMMKKNAHEMMKETLLHHAETSQTSLFSQCVSKEITLQHLMQVQRLSKIGQTLRDQASNAKNFGAYTKLQLDQWHHQRYRESHFLLHNRNLQIWYSASDFWEPIRQAFRGGTTWTSVEKPWVQIGSHAAELPPKLKDFLRA